jgi:hypothetical protein
MRINRVSFSLLLPALELAVWLMLVPTQVGLIFWQLEHGTSAASFDKTQPDTMYRVIPNIVLAIPQEQARAPKHPLLSAALLWGTMRNSHLVMAINLPGIFVEALISLPTSWPDSWHPTRLTLESWRAIILPFFCLPFWWFAGTGVDAALARKRLHWVALLIGTIFCSLFVIMFIGLRFGMSETERGEVVDWVFNGIAFWAITFAVFPFTWILRRRVRPTLAEE